MPHGTAGRIGDETSPAGVHRGDDPGLRASDEDRYAIGSADCDRPIGRGGNHDVGLGSPGPCTIHYGGAMDLSGGCDLGCVRAK